MLIFNRAEIICGLTHLHSLCKILQHLKMEVIGGCVMSACLLIKICSTSVPKWGSPVLGSYMLVPDMSFASIVRIISYVSLEPRGDLSWP